MKLPVALIACTAFALPAAAATRTVTFDERFIDSDGQIVWMESQGFGYETSAFSSDPDTLTLHDDYGITSTTIALLKGGVFTPKKIDITAFSNVYRTGDGPAPSKDDDTYEAWAMEGIAPQPILSFTGYLLSGSTAVQNVSATHDFELTELMFGPEFADIYALSLTILFPKSLEPDEDGYARYHFWNAYGLDGKSGQDWCVEYCAEFAVDNLVVDAPAEVPLPASGLLLAAAGLTLAGLRAVRRV